MARISKMSVWAFGIAFSLSLRASPLSKIEHLVVIVQENHSFDSYFGRYCQAKTGSSPTCTEGANCCEAGPAHDPGTGKEPIPLTEELHQTYNPSHSRECEVDEISYLPP